MELSGNIYANIPKNSEQEIFVDLLKNDSLKIERIISYGNSSEKNLWYDQPHSEWVLLLKGSATIQFEVEKELIEMLPGKYIFIPPHKKHRVVSTDSKQPTIWLAIHF
jgi:cupin 2 domain-containing protein